MVISRDKEPEQNKSLALALDQNLRWILVFINSKTATGSELNFRHSSKLNPKLKPFDMSIALHQAFV